ncbi:hypothetical protein BDK51DRAFT_11852, partial [Blyttiomyces helicus]
LVIRNQRFHASHFTCAQCKQILIGGPQGAREHAGKLYCLPDFERITSRVCFACRRPIVGRSVTAIGKQYHLEHFLCSRCEKPFNDSTYWEYRGKPYCETHYHELLGEICGFCHEPVTGRVIKALARVWCEHHFRCMGCHDHLATGKAAFLDWDTKPYCRRCFEALAVDVRKRIARYGDIDKK